MLQVRLESILPSATDVSVLFCTTGVLMRRMQGDPQLENCDFVIMDEVLFK